MEKETAPPEVSQGMPKEPEGRLSTTAMAGIVFASGCCALIYQIAWFRHLRLIFGASTGANAAVMAIFLGGLGLGSWRLGRRADASTNPLRFYSSLELGIAAAAAASPFVIQIIRFAYLALGGTVALGPVLGTGLRLLLCALALGVPTFLMGGTLPAAVRAVEGASDVARRRAGVLYGSNTIGAALGAFVATFFLIEFFGISRTLWVAAGLNTVVALVAWKLALGTARPAGRLVATNDQDEAAEQSILPLVAAAVAGFSFLLMELVWYRMLAPLLGGSSYTFGLILAIALLGIGVGGILYGRSGQSRPTYAGMAAVFAFYSVAVVLPYALGDRIALLAAVLRTVEVFGFWPLVATWIGITALVVFPAAVLSGYLLPLIVALLGTGDRAVGRHVGTAYAWNSAAAILGSLTGGFGLLPLLSAPTTWIVVSYMLAGFSAAVFWFAWRRRVGATRSWLAFGFAVVAVILAQAEGPTAFWRHSAIGAGRLALADDPNGNRELIHSYRRNIVWEEDGRESSVGLLVETGYSFIVNGKADGHTLLDAPTQVMSGLIGAIEHPNPRRVLVIGLGTGSTAGWLAQVPSVEKVDVIELEPSILHIARVSSPVNHDVLTNPKVEVIIGDGREFLLTTDRQYDLIFSEPSNPYRAGIASLFTREFYRAAAARLQADGIFVQWIQAYEVHPDTVWTVCATLGEVFESIETWEIQLGSDLVLVAKRNDRPHDVEVLRARANSEPYASALRWVWGVSGIEGLFTGFVGGSPMAGTVRRAVGNRINTDDRPVIEFEFVRYVGRSGLFNMSELRVFAAGQSSFAPQLTNGSIDWRRVSELRSVRAVTESYEAQILPGNDPATQHRAMARQAYHHGRLAQAREIWFAQDELPREPQDIIMVAELLADVGAPEAMSYIDQLRSRSPAEHYALLAAWHFNGEDPVRACAQLVRTFELLRETPWAHQGLIERAFDLVWKIGREHPELAPPLFEALSEPFAVRAHEERRRQVLVWLTSIPGVDSHCVEVLESIEPHIFWARVFLERREACYRRHLHPLAEQAKTDLARFDSLAIPPVTEKLRLPSP